MTARLDLIAAVDAINARRSQPLPPYLVMYGRRDGPHLLVDLRKPPHTPDLVQMIDDLREHGGMP